MRKLMFLPDLQGSLSPEKYHVLEKYAEEVMVPNIDYTSGPVFEDMLRLAEQHKPDAIGGIGIGAHIARHISDRLRIPAVLVSPEIDSVTCAELQPIKEAGRVFKEKYVAVGQKDNVVSRPAIYKHARANGYELLLLQDVGHVMTAENLDQAMGLFVNRFCPEAVSR